MEKFLEQAAAHRVPGARRQLRQRDPPRRARLLDAAPAPEGHRGSACARASRPSSARRWASACVDACARDRLPQRRHARVPVPGRRVLLHRDEHPHPGRAPGDRAHHRHRPRQGAARDRGRRASAAGRRTTSQIRGHAIECRINAEDPKKFTPSPGPIKLWHAPGGPGIRVDSHIYTGYNVPPYYDSLIAEGHRLRRAPRRRDRAHDERADRDRRRRHQDRTCRCTRRSSTTRRSAPAAPTSTTSSGGSGSE